MGVNDTLMSLSDQTMPRYYSGKRYVPYTVFTESQHRYRRFLRRVERPEKRYAVHV
jgi:hypothetical protein